MQMKSLWNCAEEYNNFNRFCYDIQDRLNVLFQSTMGMKRSQNMSNQEKTALRKLRLNKNVNVVINDTDKNVGPACADKTEVIEECRRQLYEKKVYNQLTQEEAKPAYSSHQKTSFKYCEQTHNQRELFEKRVRISAFKFEQIQHSSLLYHLENFEKSNCRQTNCGWVQLDTYSSFDICWTLPYITLVLLLVREKYE